MTNDGWVKGDRLCITDGPNEGVTGEMDYCPNCRRDYEDTPSGRGYHMAPCDRCVSDGHSACQHKGCAS